MAIRPYPVPENHNVGATANVNPEYKHCDLDDIRSDLDTRRTPLVNITMNLTNDFNKSSVIRANNAFSGRAVYIVGRRKYDKRGAVGTYKYEHVFSADTLFEVVATLKDEGYKIYGVDNLPEHKPVNLWDAVFPAKSAFIYGEENRGLQPDEIVLCDRLLSIEQTGSVRSLNVSQAAACIMSEYSRQHRL